MKRGPLVVVGDALLDRDVVGEVNRLCPDAPVPVVSDPREYRRPGGAALAALLAAQEGVPVVWVTGLAGDPDGEYLRTALARCVEVVAGPAPEPTPRKERVRGSGRTLLRVDRDGRPGPPEVTEDMLAAIDRAGVVLVSDYGRGLTGVPELRERLTRVAARRPVVWDPHPRGAPPVPGARLVTPNLAEAGDFCDLTSTGSTIARAAHCARELVGRWSVASVAVTLGAAGALLDTGGGSPRLLPAPEVTCLDPSGAGDQFAAAAAAALHRGALLMEAVGVGVAASATFVARGGFGRAFEDVEAEPDQSGGTAAEVVERVRARGGTVVATGGCFDLLHAGHVATLAAARRLGDCLIVVLNSDRSVRRLKGPGRPVVPERDRASVLAALGCVDAVEPFDDDTPDRTLRALRPDVWVKGGDYSEATLPEADLVRGWGGQVVVLPYLSGRSTTRLVRTAAETLRRR